jgi:hypothetical protein
MKALKQLCIPRKSVFDISKRDTVLNLTHLTDDKISAAEFFGENSVTDGMRTLLIEAHRRLQGKSSQAVFKLTQAMGGFYGSVLARRPRNATCRPSRCVTITLGAGTGHLFLHS